jgi:gamma-glutamyltranspeptidase/glutathione hydrolase
MTCTVNTSWGSKVTVPGTGVMLNNQMDDFSIAPGTPNAFGLVGSQANAVEARKRPLSSMSPTMVLDAENRPWLTCGAAGGPKIINATLQVLLRVIDLGQPIDVAIAAPRVHHQWRPDQLQVETLVGAGTPYAISPETIDGLKRLGHPLKVESGLAIAQGIQRRGDRLIAAHDPRAQGLSEA